MSDPTTSFDRAGGLADLLPAAKLVGIGAALGGLLGDTAVLDADGGVLWGTLADNARKAPLTVELEPIGYLAAAAEPAHLAAAAALLGEILRAALRYRMVSELHLEAVAADYERLKVEHAALQESEARYKALSAQLEQRVAEQVATLETRQRQLYQAEKLASVGQLAAGVAHEINNPIGFIHSNLKTFGNYLAKFAALKDRLAEPGAWQALDLDFIVEDGHDLVADSIAGADRIARIVKDLRGFSNIDGPDEEVVDVNEILRTACSVVDGQRPGSVAVDLDLQPVPPLLCLPGLLSQVFLNVLLNAVQAAPAHIRVASRSEGGIIRIEFADDGIGIPADQLERVFDPFFTTRDVGQGSGLGLTVARDIVRAHDGTIDIESAVGRGTTVRLTLPAN